MPVALITRWASWHELLNECLSAAYGATSIMSCHQKGMVLENVKHIDATMSAVWSVTVDVEQWPEWTPTVKSVRRLDTGPFVCGSSALIQQPGLPKAKWVVTALIPGERFTWESRIPGIRMIATHELSTRETGTQSILRLEMSGILARLLWPLMCIAARRSLERENTGLKAKCEALATQ